MTRTLLVAAVAVAMIASPAPAGAPAPAPSTAAKFAASEVIVTGKVTAIEKDTVDATSPYPGAKDKVAYKVAVVKIDGALAGAEKVTHIKIGFVPPDPNAPPVRGSGGVIRPREPVPELKEGQAVLVFLSKHPTADFYVMPYRYLPADLGTDAGKKELEQVKKFATVLADPMKGLRSDTAAVRAETALLLVTKYRTAPTLAPKIEQVPVAADESKLILQALVEGNWNSGPALLAFLQLGLTEKDGWKDPVVKPGENYIASTKDAFVKWLDAPGKDYRVKKFVPKK